MAAFDLLFNQARVTAGPPPADMKPAAPQAAGTRPKPPLAAANKTSATVDIADRHNDIGFLCPSDLTQTQILPRKVALIGSCLMECWGLHKHILGTSNFDLIAANNAATLPDMATAAAGQPYDLQIIQIPLRSILPDHSFWGLAFDDQQAHEAIFKKSCDRLAAQLDRFMAWNKTHGLLTLVTTFLVPQQTPLGGLLPRYDLRNPEHFLYRLNEHLESLLQEYKNTFLLDLDRISASYGRRFLQEDHVAIFSHGALMGLPLANDARLEPMAAMVEYYQITWPDFLAQAIWSEIVKLYRVTQGADQVKLVIVDLDDTLWEGVGGEADDIGPEMFEGWAEGLVEALLYLKKRGILLAIASKNDEARVREIWPKIFRRMVSLDEFAILRINFRPKPENIADILATLNILPRNALFIDDNPAERAAVQKAFPDLRVLGRHPYYLRRILLWSSETQVAAISAEAARRTAMSQGQVQREASRAAQSREAFLLEAAPKITAFWIRAAEDPRLPRILELINRTNQFNTTGQRRTQEELKTHFAEGGRILAFEAEDHFTSYGLTGAVLVQAGHIAQWVMSCRILGYDMEQAVMSILLPVLGKAGPITARLVATELNLPCRDLYQRCGFRPQAGLWHAPSGHSLPIPPHVTCEVAPQAAA